MKGIPFDSAKKGDVILIDFVHEDGTYKRRPVLVTKVDDGKLTVAKITSTPNDRYFDYLIQDRDAAGLRRTSTVRCDDENIIKRSDYPSVQKTGELPEKELNKVDEITRQYRQSRFARQKQQSSIQQYCDAHAQSNGKEKDTEHEK